MTAEYVFKNTGRTPALGVLSAAQFHVLKGEGEPEPTVQFDMRTVRRDIGAGETYIARTGRILSDEEWTHLRAGTHVLFLFGAIQYMDVFKLPISQTTVPNYSNFCAQYVMDSTGVGILRPVKCRIEIR
jgi:hypothetical protein